MYAENTSVPIEKSMQEIVTLVKKAGAKAIGQAESEAGYSIQFALDDRQVRFRVPLPRLDDMPLTNGRGSRLTKEQRLERQAQRHRQRARALLLVIKAKLESVESGVETFEEAFLANVVTPGGATVYERLQEPLALEYQSGAPRDLFPALEGPRNGR